MEIAFLIIALVISVATVVPGAVVCVRRELWGELGRISFLGALLIVSIVALYLN